MKKFRKLWSLYLIMTTFAITSCDLEEEIPDRLREVPPAIGPIFSSIKDAYSFQGQAYGMQNLSSDEQIGPTRGADWDDNGKWRQLHAHTWTPVNEEIVNGWNSLQTGIIRANLAIQAFEEQDDLVGAGQARLLRGFLLWQVADLFGAIPYRDVNEEGDIFDPPPVISRSAAIDTAVADLESAISVLPTRAEAGYDPLTVEAASGILAKVLLNRFVYDGMGAPSTTDLDRVIQLVDNVIASGQFSLVPGDQYFTANFGVNNEQSTEMVFMALNEAEDGNEYGSRHFMTLHYNQNPGGWNGFTTIADFYNKWDQEDVRFGAPGTEAMQENSGLQFGFLEGQQFDQNGNPLEDRLGNPLSFTVDVALTGNAEVEGVRVLKIEPDYETSPIQNTRADLPLIRYPDLLLVKAEALWRKGMMGEAMTIINEIRSNRGTTPISSISGDGQEVLDERGFELYWEGHRRTDLIRFGKFNDAWTEKAPSAPTRNLFPYPQVAVDTNPNLQQNEGY